MKTVLLLAFAVLVSGAALKKDQRLLGELQNSLDHAVKNLTNQSLGEEIFMTDLKTKGKCSEHMFCHAEHELKTKVSGLTGYNDFRTDGRLMRNLNEYNRHHETTCKTAAKDQDQIPLKDFLEVLKTCSQKTYSKKN